MNIGGFPYELQVFKNKNFCFEKWSLLEQNEGWFFTLRISLCEGVGE